MKIRSFVFLTICLALALPLFTVNSCTTAKQLSAFDVMYSFPKVYFSYGVKYQKLPEVTLYTGKLSIDMDSILTANHVPSGIIASAYLSKLAMVITAPPGATFNWLEAVRMIGSVDSTFQQTTELGSAVGINPDATTVELVLNKVDIKPILFKNSYYLKILATPSGQVPSASVNMYLDSQVRLHIEPL
jgi:hypothetical protein